MKIHPAIQIAGIGGIAYLSAASGIIVKGNPLSIALTWAVAELATLVFLKLYKELSNHWKFDMYDPEYPVRLIVGSAACIFLSDYEKVTKTIQAVAALSIFCILPDIINHLE